jgi:hypothetical protein
VSIASSGPFHWCSNCGCFRYPDDGGCCPGCQTSIATGAGVELEHRTMTKMLRETAIYGRDELERVRQHLEELGYDV